MSTATTTSNPHGDLARYIASRARPRAVRCTCHDRPPLAPVDAHGDRIDWSAVYSDGGHE